MQGNLKKMMEMAQQMQQKLAQAQVELGKMEIVGEAAGSGVAVTLNGQGDVLRVTIPKGVIDPEDPAMLEDLVLTAMKVAQKKQKDIAKEHMSKTAGIPGMPNLPFL